MSGSEKEGKNPKEVLSEDSKKMNSFYNFKLGEEKFTQIQKQAKTKLHRFVFVGVVFGFFTEYLLGNSKIYSNIVTKSTMRRLSTSLLSRR